MKPKTKKPSARKQRQEALDELLLQLDEINPKAIQWPDLQDAIIGIVSRFGTPDLLCYDFDKMVKILMKRDKMTRDEAVEFLDFNTLGAYHGEGTPAVLHKL